MVSQQLSISIICVTPPSVDSEELMFRFGMNWKIQLMCMSLLKVLDDSGLLMLEQGRVSLNIESLLLS
jgi:hypothetical protein